MVRRLNLGMDEREILADTDCPPAPFDVAATAVPSAIADRQHVLGRARSLAEHGETRLALHVVDRLALAPGDAPEVQEARTLRAEPCRKRAEEVEPDVSKACCARSVQLLEAGHRSWTGFD